VNETCLVSYPSGTQTVLNVPCWKNVKVKHSYIYFMITDLKSVIQKTSPKVQSDITKFSKQIILSWAKDESSKHSGQQDLRRTHSYGQDALLRVPDRHLLQIFQHEADQTKKRRRLRSRALCLDKIKLAAPSFSLLLESPYLCPLIRLTSSLPIHKVPFISFPFLPSKFTAQNVSF